MGVLGRFSSDQRGGVAIMFGLLALPVIGLVGAAIDYSRLSVAHTRLQTAADQAALSIVKLPVDASQATIDKVARDAVEAMFKSQIGARTLSGVTLSAPTVTRDGKTVNVRTSANADVTLMQVFGQGPATVSAKSEALWTAKKIELALVLDNTGSMRDSIGGGRRKIDALKDSAAKLLSDLRSDAKEADTIKVSIVPFDTEVRLDPAAYRSKPWFDWTRSGSDPARWTGYVFDRWNGYATSDAAPSASVPDSLFPAPQASEFASYGQLQTIKPLTSLYDLSNFTALQGVVAGMTPRGNTNVALGTMWGLATLTDSEPFSEARPASDKNVKKFMVVLTDGDNTMNHVNGVQRTNTGGQIDTKTLAACTTAKNAGVEIFTIRLVSGNAALLQSCASPTSYTSACTGSATQYFDVQDANQLGRAFRCILDSISGTRISS